MTPIILLTLATIALACVDPTWDNVDPNTFNPPTGNIFISFIGIVLPFIGRHETPVQFRLIQNTNLGIYSTMAMYQPDALDHFARVSTSNARRICPSDAKHRQVALAYSLLFGARNFLAGASPQLEAAFAAWGINADRCDAPGSCTDLSTPWGLAKKFTDEAKTYGSTDGWNADGSLSRTFNKQPYADWRPRPYEPRNSAYKITNYKKWQPITETNGLGYFNSQEHITPHIGNTARSIFYRNEDVCEKVAPNPHYRLDEEMEHVFSRMANLTDNEKMDLESFDSKLTSLVPLMAQWYVRSGPGRTLDDWDFIQVDSLIISSLYEATIVVWKEKVEWDLVRPQTYANDRFAAETVNTWAGPYQGTKPIKGSEFRAYLRTMPHTEYPSGSACTCSVFESAMRAWTGYDSIAEHVAPPGPLVFGQFDGTPFPAGSSRTEPGAVPAAPWLGFFPTWSDIAARCGQSRINGGLHFRASIDSGRSLCYSIGADLADAFHKLNAGQVPDYIVDINAPLPRPVRC